MIPTLMLDEINVHYSDGIEDINIVLSELLIVIVSVGYNKNFEENYLVIDNCITPCKINSRNIVLTNISFEIEDEF